LVLVIVLIGALTYICSRPLLLATQNENQ